MAQCYVDLLYLFYQRGADVRLLKMRSMYLIHTEHGQPYSAGGIRFLFDRARKRAGIQGVTLKDIRAEAATDADNQGYNESQLQTAPHILTQPQRATISAAVMHLSVRWF